MRTKLEENERRSKRLQIQVTPEEFQRVEDLAWSKRMTMSDLLRESVLKFLQEVEA